MLYDYLHEFTAIARTGSLSAASKVLGVSQPALGRHLTMLEADLGARLVTRDAQGVRPTAEGRYLLGMALDICSIGDEVERHFHNPSSTPGQRQISIVGLTSTQGLTGAFAAGCRHAGERGRDVTLRYRPEEDVSSPARALESEEADVVITLGAALGHDPSLDCFYRVRLCDAPCVAIVEVGSRLADRASLTLADLRETHVARCAGNFDNSDLHWEELRRRCLEQGFSPLSRTVSFDAVPHEWNLPDCVVLFRAGRLTDEQLFGKGKVVLPVEDFAYEVYGLCRPDDDVARRLLDDAAGWFAGTGR